MNVKEELFRIGCIKRAKPGEFWTLKSGETSDIYIDLRILPQHPKLINTIATLLPLPSTRRGGDPRDGLFDESTYVAGLPIGGIPLATLYSQRTNLPLLLVRKVPKDHGTSKMVEVDYSTWTNPRKLILVDDVLTTGSTVLDTIEMLKSQRIPLEVAAVVCVVNRSSPFRDQVPGTNIPIFALYKLEDLFTPRTTFGERLPLATNTTTRKLFQIMMEKKTNLCVSADVDTSDHVLSLLKATGPYIAMLKCHFDAIRLCDVQIRDILEVAKQMNVLILSDRKYADIGSTITKKLRQCIDEQPDCCTIHTFSGPGGIESLHRFGIGAVLVAEMSNKGSLTDDDFFSSYYAAKTASLATTSGVMGIVCQSRENCEAGDGIIYMTPGVHEASKTDGADQRYRTCHEAIAIQKNDMVIVGRGIYEASNPAEAALRYRDAAWAALSK